MKVLVTGGAGFIGSHLVEALLARGDSVHVIDLLTTSNRSNLAHLEGNPNLRVTIDSVLNEPLMDEAIRETDLVFHLAAALGVKWILERPLESLETNLRGTDVVMKAADRHHRRVLIASTSEVYGKNDSGPLKENDDRILGSSQLSRWFYATAKAADEALAAAYWQEKRLPTIAVRFFNTIGPRQTGQYGMVVPRFIGQALQHEPITVFGDGRQSRCFTYVGDVVKSIVALTDTEAAWGEVFNVGRQAEITIADLASRVVELTGSRSEIVYVPYEQAYSGGFEDMRRRVPDVTKLRATIGYAPDTELDESLRRIIAVHPSNAARVS
jgi:UDP-glucose 4-epimerase